MRSLNRDLLDDEVKLLLEKIANADESAFKLLFDLYHRKVLFIAKKILKEETYAIDALQEVFIKIWINRSKLPDIENFDAYFNALVRNCMYDHLKKHAFLGLMENAVGEDVETEDGNTLNIVLGKDLQNTIAQALEHLPPQQKRVFELSRFEGLKYHEIADLLHISKETVKKHIVRASRFVKGYLISHGHMVLLCTLINFF
ncbi:RNA polymerase sigma factor [Pinibacter aurantiacus]|uniref:RNA polymerase sigma-70 factor n=1 Tax=Pinibacter aurantiacus TaxID=2851599 RepID=A0A9E2WA00_9BACT|nr:RNA polymerase sigma-70 factor [Pinibacter aurantiacus]MBV4360587.1 RNA polymerase sigma-70 factor [Pinibacter aurantiacus]